MSNESEGAVTGSVLRPVIEELRIAIETVEFGLESLLIRGPAVGWQEELKALQALARAAGDAVEMLATATA